MGTLTHALKEWQVTVKALTQGETILLLRKGGIQERGGRFTVQHDRVWLYPTVEHQQSELLKPRYAVLVKSGATESESASPAIALDAWAEVAAVMPVRDQVAAYNLLPWHVWNQDFVTARWQWKPERPLLALVLRVYRLAVPIQIPYQAAYGGCRSWLELGTAIATEPSVPVLEDAQFAEQLAAIRAIVD